MDEVQNEEDVLSVALHFELLLMAGDRSQVVWKFHRVVALLPAHTGHRRRPDCPGPLPEGKAPKCADTCAWLNKKPNPKP